MPNDDFLHIRELTRSSRDATSLHSVKISKLSKPFWFLVPLPSGHSAAGSHQAVLFEHHAEVKNGRPVVVALQMHLG